MFDIIIMELSLVYQYAKAFKSYSEFKTQIAKIIDNVPQTVQHNNAF